MRIQATLAVVLAACIPAHALSILDQPLRTLRLPRLAFTNASLATVAETLEREYATFAKDRRPSEISVLVHPSCTNIAVTLDLKDVSVNDSLRLLEQMYDVNHFTTEGNIILSKQRSAPMILRIYDVLPSVFPPSPPGRTDAVAYLSRCGVPFPDGATAQYAPQSGELFVSNTSENLELLEGVLSSLNRVQDQVEVTLRVILVDDSAAEQAWAQPSPTNIDWLISRSEPLCRMTTMASSGQTASNRLCTPVATTKSASVSSQVYLEVCPSVSADGRIITMPFKASLSLPYEKRQLLEYACDSSATFYNGATLLFWLSPAARADGEKHQIALLLSVRLIDPAGRPLQRSKTVPSARPD